MEGIILGIILKYTNLSISGNAPLWEVF